MALKLKVKKGDNVIVTAGKDKGKTGEVLRVFPKDGRVLVQGVNTVRRHAKPSRADPSGGIIEKEVPIHLSNVAHIDPKTNRPTRVGYKVLEGGRKVRYAKGSGEMIDL